MFMNVLNHRPDDDLFRQRDAVLGDRFTGGYGGDGGCHLDTVRGDDGGNVCLCGEGSIVTIVMTIIKGEKSTRILGMRVILMMMRMMMTAAVVVGIVMVMVVV